MTPPHRNGQPDAGFGVASAFAALPDGRMYTRDRSGISCFDAAANLDPPFGTGGHAPLDFSSDYPALRHWNVSQIVVQADGKLVLAGTVGGTTARRRPVGHDAKPRDSTRWEAADDRPVVRCRTGTHTTESISALSGKTFPCQLTGWTVVAEFCRHETTRMNPSMKMINDRRSRAAEWRIHVTPRRGSTDVLCCATWVRSPQAMRSAHRRVPRIPLPFPP
ncbi:hypothetical protein PCA20602_02568 [Pandoraea capi]|uniref:Uncharacterized protein n=1 Tax=Pandoraea capi TaxID=2508286 RepID=A0ABY6VZZ6_9BURK|nr:hypothetical protein PCA20602_02568 [Pandoraea capi]